MDEKFQFIYDKKLYPPYYLIGHIGKHRHVQRIDLDTFEHQI